MVLDNSSRGIDPISLAMYEFRRILVYKIQLVLEALNLEASLFLGARGRV
jgi:hypothetical protein